MDSHDFIKLSNKAKSETEAFINRHLNDGEKGWPKSSLCDTNYADYRREGRTKKAKYQECS